MPAHPVIDTHVHLWDPSVMRYPWLDGLALLNRAYLPQDYREATSAVSVERVVFVQCEAESAAYEHEVVWAERQAELEPRIQGVVAWAPLEKGNAVTEDLIRLKRYKLVRGIRRIIQFEPDLNFCVRPEFVAGVRSLGDFGLSFEICIDHRQMESAIKLIERAGNVRMVLDHIGKPPIREGGRSPWREQLRLMASFPNVFCKISGVATEADHRTWSSEELGPYIVDALEAFGFDRVMFGSDWPVSLQAISYGAWISLLDRILAGVPETEQKKFWHDNAVHVYRLASGT